MNGTMKTVAATLFAITLAFSSGQSSHAKYRFLSPTEMIQNSDVIAIVDISSVEDVETTSEHWTYTQRAHATIDQLIKGRPEKSIILVGKLKKKLCVPDWTLEPGKQLVFIRKRKSNDDYVSANSGAGLLPIRNGKVAWFSNMNTLDTRIEMPLSTALTSIRAHIKPTTSEK